MDEGRTFQHVKCDRINMLSMDEDARGGKRMNAKRLHVMPRVNREATFTPQSQKMSDKCSNGVYSEGARQSLA